MKKLAKHSFVFLLVLTMLVAAPKIYAEMGVPAWVRAHILHREEGSVPSLSEKNGEAPPPVTPENPTEPTPPDPPAPRHPRRARREDRSPLGPRRKCRTDPGSHRPAGTGAHAGPR